MLEELSIHGYALIDSAHIDFTGGLNVLTGETGAGKSILLGALSLLFGEKGEVDSIRTGEEEAVVSAVFRIGDDREAREWLDSREIAPEDGTVLVRRTLKRSGRGAIFVQSASVTKSDLKELTSLIFDLHGQHQHQSLLATENHRKLVDRYAGIEDKVDNLTATFSALNKKRKDYERMISGERDRLREKDILGFSIHEIEEAKLVPGEEEELAGEIKLLNESERLFSLLDTLYENTSESRGGALAPLRKARSAMEETSKIVDDLAPLSKRLDDAFFEIEDVAESVREFREGVDFSPQRLEACEERMAVIRNLEKKYGDTIEDVLKYLEKSREELQRLENWEEGREDIEKEIQDLERKITSVAREISSKRKSAASDLKTRVLNELTKLGMPQAQFEIAVTQKVSEKGKPVCGPYGYDRIEFLISPNAGEPVKSLKNIASGGELSRIMLAMKTVFSEIDGISGMIFDEIDVGIGGEVAVSVAEHLHNLARGKQVLCITHLATIAVRADNHIKVTKRVEKDRTVTRVDTLDYRERIKEIARMLSGDTEGEASVRHARELLERHNPSFRRGEEARPNG
jgi:DNA repair protein RecN (Recombination protein N)